MKDSTLVEHVAWHEGHVYVWLKTNPHFYFGYPAKSWEYAFFHNPKVESLGVYFNKFKRNRPFEKFARYSKWPRKEDKKFTLTQRLLSNSFIVYTGLERV